MFSMKLNKKDNKSKSKSNSGFSFNNHSKSKAINKRNEMSDWFGSNSEKKDSSLSNRQLINKQAKERKKQQQISKMIKQDPSIFQYDEVYERFEEKRNKEYRAKEIDKTLRPVRYINTITKVAQQRQIRHDAAHQRKLVKEREKDDHLFQNKQKYITRAYKDKLAEIEEQRLKDKQQSEKEKTINDDPGMMGFFNGYLRNKTNENKKNDDRNHNRKSLKSKEEQRSRSRSRSRSRDRGNSKLNKDDKELNEEQRFHIKQYQQEFNKPTFDDTKQKVLDKEALKKCERRTTKSDLQSLRERYLKRKSERK